MSVALCHRFLHSPRLSLFVEVTMAKDSKKSPAEKLRVVPSAEGELSASAAGAGLMTSGAPPQSLLTSVTESRSNSVRNSASVVASAGRERGEQHHHRPVTARR